jgi:hypothetical protein
MHPSAVRIFLNEARGLTEHAFVAFADLDRAVANLHGGGDRISPIFRALNQILSDVGRLSLIFWPVDRKAADRGRYLRDLIGLDEDNPLRSRELRNHLEHLDERIDAWSRGNNHALLDHNIGPIEWLHNSGFHPQEGLRHYDPWKKFYVFQGSEYEIGPLFDCLTILQGRVLEALDRLA